VHRQAPNTVKRDMIGRCRGTCPKLFGHERGDNAERKTGLDDMMTKIEAVIQNSKLEAVKTALHEIGVEGMTVIEVRGHGRQKGHTEVYRGREYSVDLIPKTKIEMVLPDALVEKAEQAILTAARTGKIGDGKIFRSRVDEAIRIRNDERGEGAL
jgi:nitrogen regulatory protein P-II 1